MSVQNPINLQEWEQYVDRYAGVTLRELAETANTHKFFHVLTDEGWDVRDIKKILVFFARKMLMVGVVPPPGGVYLYENLITLDPIASKIPRRDFEGDGEEGDESPEDVFDEMRTEPAFWEQELLDL